MAKQQAAKLGGGKGGALGFIADQVAGLGPTPDSVGVPLPPPLPEVLPEPGGGGGGFKGGGGGSGKGGK